MGDMASGQRGRTGGGASRVAWLALGNWLAGIGSMHIIGRTIGFVLLIPLCTQGADVEGRAKWISVANRLIEAPPEAFPFNWGEGVQWIGLMKVYEQTMDQRYLTYMERWTALHSGKDIRELLNTTGTPHSKEHSAYCGHWSPATAILYMNRAKPKEEYARIARQTAEFITKGAERSPAGGLGHWEGSHQLWVDTLYMACPLLAGVGRDLRRPAYIADAAQQILTYAKPLQDETAGLFYHMWDWQTKERTAALWGRGNGWVLMSIADVIEVLERKDPLYGQLMGVAQRMLDGMARTRDTEGMWHTVMDDPKSYPETSATAMFCYGVKKLIRLGALPSSKAALVEPGWGTIQGKYVKDGLVTGVSAGTVPKDHVYYKTLPAGTQTWGTGAYLMAGSEMYR